MELPTPFRPDIAGPWQVLFKPEKTGCYVNDHTLLQGRDSSWHIIGITRPDAQIKPDHERYFAHGRGESLLSASGFKELGPVCDFGRRAWAPSCTYHDGRYYLIYGPGEVCLAVSEDLREWRPHPIELCGCPIDGCLRDQMVLQIRPDAWLMYATALHGGAGQVSVFISNDLVSWRFIQYALRTFADSPLNPPWGATESPFVVFYEGWYYLFVTYTNSSIETYHDTLVFRSLNPFDFGEYRGDDCDLAARLHAHAPEIVFESGAQQWYITTCGWRGRNIPIEGAAAIAPLRWVRD